MRVDIIDKPATRGFILCAPRTIGMVPIHKGIIEAHSQSLGSGRVDVLPNEITTRRLLWSAIVRGLGIEMTKALVVLGGHHHVLLPRTFSKPRPIASSVRLGIELLCDLLVF